MATDKTPRRSIRASTRLKQQVQEYAYRRRVSTSSVVGDVVRDFVLGNFAPEAPTEPQDDLLRFGVAEADWSAALAKASKAGLDLSSIIRDRLEEQLQN